jgi:hypothetical protein
MAKTETREQKAARRELLAAEAAEAEALALYYADGTPQSWEARLVAGDRTANALAAVAALFPGPSRGKP